MSSLKSSIWNRDEFTTSFSMLYVIYVKKSTNQLTMCDIVESLQKLNDCWFSRTRCTYKDHILLSTMNMNDWYKHTNNRHTLTLQSNKDKKNYNELNLISLTWFDAQLKFVENNRWWSSGIDKFHLIKFYVSTKINLQNKQYCTWLLQSRKGLISSYLIIFLFQRMHLQFPFYFDRNHWFNQFNEVTYLSNCLPSIPFQLSLLVRNVDLHLNIKEFCTEVKTRYR